MVYFEAAEASSGLSGLALAASIHAPHSGRWGGAVLVDRDRLLGPDSADVAR